MFTPLLILAFWEKIKAWKGKTAKGVKIACTSLFFICLAAFVSISAAMAWAANVKPATDDTTVIVLGCQVQGIYPSKMLGRRIQAAAEHMKSNETEACIATGAQGRDEKASEADVEKTYLQKAGVSGSRIYIEDKSASTAENIKNAAKIINDNHLSKNVVIATDAFHELRAHIIAKRNGLNPSAASCVTPWYLFFYYWMRETFAIVQVIVFPS